MRRRFKVLLGGLAVVGVLVALGAGALFYLVQQPFYRPGGLAAAMSGEAARPAPVNGPWLVEPGISLHHFATGSGRDALVLHGGPGIPFPEPIEALRPFAGRFRFHYYDQRGCGQSTRPFDRFPKAAWYDNAKTLERTLGLGAQVKDVERIRRLLGVDRLVLVGHSFGGFLAALYAAEFPDRVAGLVLVAPAAVLVLPSPDGELFASVGALLPAESKQEYEVFVREYLDFGALFDRTESEIQAKNGRFARYYSEAARARGFDVPPELPPGAGGFMVQAQYLSMGRRHDYRPALRAIRSPVLVVHGGRDLQQEKASRSYVDAIPGAGLAVIEGSGHMPFADAPQRFAEVVAPFLDGLQ
jgi:proline iminopeptidase